MTGGGSRSRAKRRGCGGGKPRVALAKLKRTIGEIGILPGWDEEDAQAALVMLAPLSIGTRDAGGRSADLPASRCRWCGSFTGESRRMACCAARRDGRRRLG